VEALCVAQEEHYQLKDNVEPKSLLLTTAEKEVDEKSRVPANVNVMPALSPDDAVGLETHE